MGSPDTYELAKECQTIADRLVATDPVFVHVQGARVACLFSGFELKLRGAKCAAFIIGPTIQGPLRDFFEWSLERFTDALFDGEPCDFLVLFDRGYYHGLGPVGRERLVFHELKHLQPVTNAYGEPQYHADGRPKLRTVPHDTEVFDDEVRRYGVDICGLESHVRALEDSRRKPNAGAA